MKLTHFVHCNDTFWRIKVNKNCCNCRSDKKTLCNESVSGKKNVKLLPSAVPPPIPMSPIVEKMEGLKAIRNRSNSLRLGRLAFYRHLEKVETMRCFWELKHVELEGGNQQVKHSAFALFTPWINGVNLKNRCSLEKENVLFHLHRLLYSCRFLKTAFSEGEE